MHAVFSRIGVCLAQGKVNSVFFLFFVAQEVVKENFQRKDAISIYFGSRVFTIRSGLRGQLRSQDWVGVGRKDSF